METARLPKFRWGEISDLNSGHTPNEWGSKPQKKEAKFSVAYDVAWKS